MITHVLRQLMLRRMQRGSTPLHKAASNGNIDMLRLLVAGGADVNAVDTYDKPPLHSISCGDNKIFHEMVAVLSKPLAAFLEGHELLKHTHAFVKLGVTQVSHMAGLELKDVKSIRYKRK